MTQLNLLPDVKLKYLKAQRIRRLTIVVAIMVSAAALGILILLLLAEVYQKHTLNNLNNDVAAKTSQLQGEPHINNVLTVQNQLNSINTLHDSEPAATKLFDYLNELTPSTVTISSLSADFNARSMEISGSASGINNINQFVDTLKFTTYSTGKNTANNLAFNNVVLSSFGVSSQGDSSSPASSYTIDLNFDPTIFIVTKNVALSVPSIVTTRSSLENPGPLFVKGASSSNGGSR